MILRSAAAPAAAAPAVVARAAASRTRATVGHAPTAVPVQEADEGARGVYAARACEGAVGVQRYPPAAVPPSTSSIRREGRLELRAEDGGAGRQDQDVRLEGAVPLPREGRVAVSSSQQRPPQHNGAEKSLGRGGQPPSFLPPSEETSVDGADLTAEKAVRTSGMPRQVEYR